MALGDRYRVIYCKTFQSNLARLDRYPIIFGRISQMRAPLLVCGSVLREVTRHRATKLVSGQSTPGESASVVDLEFLMEGQFLWAHFSDVFFRVKGPFRSFLGPFGLSTGDGEGNCP